jgi:hypothetical protein
MAVTKSVKIISDLVTQKQLIKQDIDGNVLFRVSGTIESGFISSSLPITGSDLVLTGKIYPGINALSDVSASNAQEGQFLKRVGGQWIPAGITAGDATVKTSGSLTGSGETGNEVRLKDDISINSVTASYVQIAGAIVNDPSSPTPFSSTEVLPGATSKIDVFSQTYNAAKYIILAKSTNHSQIAEIIVVKNPTEVSAIPYALGHTSTSPLATFSVQKNDINSTIELFITNKHLTTITVTMQRNYLI